MRSVFICVRYHFAVTCGKRAKQIQPPDPVFLTDCGHFIDHFRKRHPIRVFSRILLLRGDFFRHVCLPFIRCAACKNGAFFLLPFIISLRHPDDKMKKNHAGFAARLRDSFCLIVFPDWYTPSGSHPLPWRPLSLPGWPIPQGTVLCAYLPQ